MRKYRILNVSGRIIQIAGIYLLPRQERIIDENLAARIRGVRGIMIFPVAEELSEEKPAEAPQTSADELEKLVSVNGIGEKTAQKLLDNGVTYEKLLEMMSSEPEKIEEIVGPRIFAKIKKSLNA